MGIQLEMIYPYCRNCGYLFGVTEHLWKERSPRGSAIYCPSCGNPSQVLCSRSLAEKLEAMEEDRDALQVQVDRDARAIRSLRGYIASKRRRGPRS